MINFQKLFGLSPRQSQEQRWGTLFTKLESLLSGLSEDDMKYVTGISGLLCKTAYSDREFSHHELDEMRKVLGDISGVSEEVAERIVDCTTACTQELSGIEDHYYARLLNEVASKEQKIGVILSLYQVAAADSSISSDEDNTIRLVARELILTHRDFIAARGQYKQYLSVLQSLAKETSE